MSINVKLLTEICEAAGAPGHEQRIREIVIREVGPLVDEIRTDNMGNVTAIKKGKYDKKVMIGAHMDEIGFIVTHIDDNGFLRFHTLGGFDPKTLTAQRVIVHGKDLASDGQQTHTRNDPRRTHKPLRQQTSLLTWECPSRGRKIYRNWKPITREETYRNCVNCKSIDNRVSVFILIEMLRELKEAPYDVYCVFTVQEEVGIRGANVATQEVQPDFGFGLDTTIAYDVPGAAPHEKITELGKGAAIKVMDSSTICDYRMVSYMKELQNIKYPIN